MMRVSSAASSVLTSSAAVTVWLPGSILISSGASSLNENPRDAKIKLGRRDAQVEQEYIDPRDLGFAAAVRRDCRNCRAEARCAAASAISRLRRRAPAAAKAISSWSIPMRMPSSPKRRCDLGRMPRAAERRIDEDMAGLRCDCSKHSSSRTGMCRYSLVVFSTYRAPYENSNSSRSTLLWNSSHRAASQISKWSVLPTRTASFSNPTEVALLRGQVDAAHRIHRVGHCAGVELRAQHDMLAIAGL